MTLLRQGMDGVVRTAVVVGGMVVVMAACGSDALVAPDPSPARLELRALPDTAGLGDTLVPDARVFDGRGNRLTEVEVTYSSQPAGAIVRLPNGALQALAEGSITVRATVGDAGDVADSATIVVTRQARRLRIALTRDSIGTGDGGVTPVAVLRVDGLGLPMDTATGVTFSSSDTAVLAVNPTTGRAVAMSDGVADLVATAGNLTGHQPLRTTFQEPHAGLAGVSGIALGRRASCASTTSGQVFCQQGSYSSARLMGFDGTAQTTPPTPAATAVPLTGVAMGPFHACGITGSGGVHCWGTQLEPITGSTGNVVTPTPLPLPDSAGPVARLAMAFDLDGGSCALTTGGTAWCWGRNTNGAIGGAGSALGALRRLDGVPPLSRLSIGEFHGCGVTGEGALWCWGGRNYFSRDGGTSDQLRTPVQVPLPKPARDVAVTLQGVCLLYQDGQVECWGPVDLRGELGRSGASGRVAPHVLPLPGTFVSVKAAGGVTCALRDDGALWCWGALRDYLGWSAPFRFAPSHTFADFSVNNIESGLPGLCASTTTGRVLCSTRP